MLGGMGRPRWSRAELAAATSEVVEAARWELFVHRLWPAKLAAELAGPDRPLTEGEIGTERRKARGELRALRARIFPADEIEEATDGA